MDFYIKHLWNPARFFMKFMIEKNDDSIYSNNKAQENSVFYLLEIKKTSDVFL